MSTSAERVPVDDSSDTPPARESQTRSSSRSFTVPEPPYSVFTRREKWFIVFLSSFAGLFSPLTANIYFPAIPALVMAFGKSTELINLTVTIYMVLQGLSPMIFGTLADQVGRRPIFCACLLILSLSCVGLALVPTSAYWLLLLLRCIQAAGSASTIALGAGVIGDISISAERGGFFGMYNVGPLVGPAIGPVIGGALADRFGWRAIFWFLCIGSSFCLVIVVLFLPETLRVLVGNGSVAPGPIHRPLIPLIGHIDPNSARPPKPSKAFKNPLLLLLNLDIVLLLVFNGVVYAVFYSITASISTLFSDIYPFLTQTTIGLCFLAIGGGMALGSSVVGKILDKDFQRIKMKRLGTSHKGDKEMNPTEAESFPIEKARLRLMPFFLTLYIGCCVAYGWCLEKRVNLAGPLILLVVIGFVAIAVMNATQTLIIDLIPSQSSSVTACNNLIRCTLGAVLVSVIELLIKALGPGWTYVLLGGICLLFSPLLYAIIKIGPASRAKRRKEAGVRDQGHSNGRPA